MATYQHLSLRRIVGELDRRKRGGFPQSEKRDFSSHGPKIQAELTAVIETQKRRPKIADIDPAFILKVTTSGPVSEEDWTRLGLTVLAVEAGRTIILFANDVELQAFKERVTAYSGEKPEGQKGQPYAGLIEAIESVGELSAEDRIGIVLRGEGFSAPADFSDSIETLDVELWPVTGFDADLFIHRVTGSLQSNGGIVLSTYRGNSALLMRVLAGGDAIRALLELPEIASLDRPPTPDWPEITPGLLTIDDVPEPVAADSDAVAIGVVDSGLTSAHPLLVGSFIAAFGEPASLGDSDEKGHGTPVSGIATFGDVRQRLSTPPLKARFRIASARVVNELGRFDDAELVPTQMENAIRRLHDEFGCRVVNISLGDIKRPVGSKPSSWAAALDSLARELDVVIVVSAGNASWAKLAALGDSIVQVYPDFLTDGSSRILEPASAVNVITVGSIAHSNGLSQNDSDNVGVRPITQFAQPSPFTRTGPGANKVMKPDLVDFGGTAVFDGPTQSLQSGASRANAGILSTHHKYLEQLLRCDSGTSFAAPLVAHKAALLLEAFPNASANLVRALLGLSAEYPQAAMACLGNDDDAVFDVLGYGVANVERALLSEDNRVVLYAEDKLAADKFAVYEVPVPDVFQAKGARQIRVALSFDPPVKHTRIDYAGIKMGFHLVRGANAQEVFDAFRKWEADEGKVFEIQGKLKCDLKPGAMRRERGTLQCATFSMKTNSRNYGDSYYLAVRCESGWSAEEQSFAVAVELRAEAEIPLYERIRERVRVRV